MDHDPVGIGAIERGAAVAMNFEWMDDRDAARNEVLFKLFDSLDALDDEAEMIELSFLRARGEVRGNLMECDIVAA